MQRIVITEQDLTTNLSSFDNGNVVYIPGFASIGAQAQVGVPVICTSLGYFKSMFGATAPTFKTTQYYPHFTSGVSAGFPDVAIPVEASDDPDYSTSVWFNVGASDPSYLYAVSLLSKGMTIVYERMNDVVDPASEYYDVTVERAYAIMETIFSGDVASPLLDKGTYNVKFITTGGYPTHEYAKTDGSMLVADIINVASTRGDCVALIDHTNNPHRPLEGTGSVIKSALVASEYAAMFTPWCVCTNGQVMPGSYIYLGALAQSIKANPSWLAIAGVARGLSNDVVATNTDKILTNRIAESYQYGYTSDGTDPTICINGITRVEPYGYVIWGNRTLKQNSLTGTGFALTFLNLRNLVSEVKKQAYTTSMSLMFEVNNDVLWTKFKASMSSLLDTMLSTSGLKNYKLLKVATGDKTKLSCQIVLYPTYAVESFNINIVLLDDDVTVEE